MQRTVTFDFDHLQFQSTAWVSPPYCETQLVYITARLSGAGFEFVVSENANGTMRYGEPIYSADLALGLTLAQERITEIDNGRFDGTM